MTTSTIGKYVLFRELGRGGMGLVYLGEDQTLRRKVAIKVLAPHLAQDRSMVARFLSEARAMAAMQHPHIVSVYEAGEDGGTPYFAMEYLDGEDLGQHLKKSGRLAFGAALEFLTAVASAIDYAHSKGVIHRDIKPANILTTSGGIAKVTDFGIARIVGESGHTATGMLVGTPAYMAPELWNGQAPTNSSDLYSLGVLGYELLSGRPPFEGDTPMTVGYGHVNKPVPKLYLAEAESKLEPRAHAAVAKMLSKNPADRFVNGSEFVENLSGDSTATRLKAGWPIIALLALIILVILSFKLVDHSTTDPYKDFRPFAERAEGIWQELPQSRDIKGASFLSDHKSELVEMEDCGTKLIRVLPADSARKEGEQLQALGHYYLGAAHYLRFENMVMSHSEGTPLTSDQLESMREQTDQSCREWMRYLDGASTADIASNRKFFDAFISLLGPPLNLNKTDDAAMFAEKYSRLKGQS